MCDFKLCHDCLLLYCLKFIIQWLFFSWHIIKPLFWPSFIWPHSINLCTPVQWQCSFLFPSISCIMRMTRQRDYFIHRKLYLKDSFQDAFLDPLKVILPIVFYGCETWSVTLREEHMLRLLFWWRYSGLRRTMQQGNGEDYIMRGSVICIPHQILFGWFTQEGEMGGACSTYGREERCI